MGRYGKLKEPGEGMGLKRVEYGIKHGNLMEGINEMLKRRGGIKT